jgi:integrase
LAPTGMWSGLRQKARSVYSRRCRCAGPCEATGLWAFAPVRRGIDQRPGWCFGNRRRPRPCSWGEAANRAAEGRHELDPGVVKKAVKRAVGGAGVCEEASWHSFRHCYWLRHAGQVMTQTSWRKARSSAPSRSCLGHRDANTTMICRHVLNLR